MCSIRKFETLNLHDDAYRTDQENSKVPFVVTAKLSEGHSNNLYGCAFNQYLDPKHTQVVATIGHSNVTIYEVPRDVNHLIRQADYTFDGEFSHQDDMEDLYTVCWCFDTYEYAQGRNPYRVVTGGYHKQIYVLDPSTMNCVNTMSEVGNCINELRPCPTNSNLVACAVKDLTVRIFHIRNASCLVVFGGMYCHDSQVLSVEWESNGQSLLSCGQDHLVIKWDLSKPFIQEHLSAASAALEAGEQNILNQNTAIPGKATTINRPILKQKPRGDLNAYKASEEDAKFVTKVAEIMNQPLGCLLTVNLPFAVNNSSHGDYVDCVRQLRDSPYIFTKGCGKESRVDLWRYGVQESETEVKMNKYGIHRNIVRLAELQVHAGNCWFTKFDIDPRSRWLPVGSSDGKVSFFNIADPTNPSIACQLTVSKSVVRQIAFSSDGRFAVAVGDQGFVTRMDRVSVSVDPEVLAQHLKK